MQKLVEFLELDKDGTWFVLLIIIMVFIIFSLSVRFIRYERLNIKFRKKYGVSLYKYCKRYDIDDYYIAMREADSDERNQKTIDKLMRNDFILSRTGVSMDEAARSFNQFSRQLSRDYILRTQSVLIPGSKVHIIKMADKAKGLKYNGKIGTVDFVDDCGYVFVEFGENKKGVRLSMADRFKKET
jgi:hypothetical protein